MAIDAGQLTRDFCAAWESLDVDAVMGFFTDDATYHNIPMDPLNGTEDIRGFIGGFLGGATKATFEIHHQVTDANITMNERTDTFVMPDNTISAPVMGVFEWTDEGKLAKWRDYFDVGQFMG